MDLRGVSNYSDTFSLAPTGAIFNLPDGYTVNSVSADVVNNRFAGGPPSATPEPPALIMLGSGLLSLAFFLRRK
jgi:PEP-CTERM motif